MAETTLACFLPRDLMGGKATREPIGATEALKFARARDTDAIFEGVMPSAYSGATGFSVLVTYLCPFGGSGNVVFDAVFERRNDTVAIAADHWDTPVQASPNAAPTSGQLKTLTIAVPAASSSGGAGIAGGEAFRLRIRRLAGSVVTDTFPADLYVVAVTVADSGTLGGGGAGASSNFAENEVPAGTIDGANATFTLAHTPLSGSVKLYLNGLKQQPGAGKDYTLSGATLTMASAPAAASVLLADYRY